MSEDDRNKVLDQAREAMLIIQNVPGLAMGQPTVALYQAGEQEYHAGLMLHLHAGYPTPLLAMTALRETLQRLADGNPSMQ